MPFVEDARVFLEQTLLPRLNHFLSESEYVNRLIFRETADVMMTRALHGLRKAQGTLDDEVLEDRELEKQPYILLLGNAGSGKSFVLTYTCIQAIQRFFSNADTPFPLFLDLDKDLPTVLSVQSIEDTLNSRHNDLFEHARRQSSCRYALFLDGLDEVLRRSPAFINDLQMFLQKHWSHVAQVVVACRRHAWSPDWFTTAPVQLSVYHADDLGWQEYAQILPEDTVQQAFFQRCRDLGIAALLDTPFDGFYLAREFRAGRPLPSSRRECLDQRITEALRGRQVDRQDGNAPSVDDLHFLAQQLACVGSFTHHTAWTLQEATDILGTSQVLRSGRAIRPEEVRTLFTRPLFKKSDEQFAFVHQLYQEFLAAEVLATLSLRKQQQLLAAKRPGQRRIQTAHRGIAISLAEVSDAFATYLIGADPLVAFLAEMPSMSQEMEEQLLKTVLDDAVASGRAPWWGIPPRGERPDSALLKHRPQEVATFLRPYLTSEDEMARIWGTACAEAWNGDRDLNEVLNQLAHDPSQHVEIRTSAVEAIAATKDHEAVRGLNDLFEDDSDEVRGRVLQAYSQIEDPSPRDFVIRLRGGSRNPDLHCLLQVETERFGDTLNASQLREAFEAVTEFFADLGNLKSYLIRGLFRRANALSFADVPADLIVQCWAPHGSFRDDLLHDEETIKQLLREQPTLFEKVWNHTLALLGRDNDHIQSTAFVEHFADCCTDRIFDILPLSSDNPTGHQNWFIEHVLTRYFYQDPTAERLAHFQRLTPDFTQSLRLPQPPRQPPPRDLLADGQKLINALTEGGQDPIHQTWNVLRAIAEIKHGARRQSLVSEDDVLHVLDETHTGIRERIIQVFRACVAEKHYQRRRTESSEIQMTHSEFELPFWVLRQWGEAFSPQKIAEIITCYYDSDTNNTRYEELLEELRQQQRALWQQHT